MPDVTIDKIDRVGQNFRKLYIVDPGGANGTYKLEAHGFSSIKNIDMTVKTKPTASPATFTYDNVLLAESGPNLYVRIFGDADDIDRVNVGIEGF